ncbi:MAG: ACT domain-containing protein [Pyrinomonadaceae bacterium]
MANEELIYRITRAVYERLGASADERMVEQLVTDVYRAIEPLTHLETGRSSSSGAPQIAEAIGAAGSAQRLVVSVFGVDRPGIVAAVSQILAECRCSIVDINQTVVQGKFAMVLIADTTGASESAAALKDRFRHEGDRLRRPHLRPARRSLQRYAQDIDVRC